MKSYGLLLICTLALSGCKSNSVTPVPAPLTDEGKQKIVELTEKVNTLELQVEQIRNGCNDELSLLNKELNELSGYAKELEQAFDENESILQQQKTTIISLENEVSRLAAKLDKLLKEK